MSDSEDSETKNEVNWDPREIFGIQSDATAQISEYPSSADEMEKYVKKTLEKDVSSLSSVPNLFSSKKKDCKAELAVVLKRLDKLQDILAAQNKYSILVILQAMDAGGKDGVVRHVFGGLNPQGVSVTSFKAPTEEERSHDFLWRVHPHVPRRGQIKVFNRSHYEDVLITRAKKWVTVEACKQKFVHIKNFESLVSSNDTVILKFYLNMSKKEQKQRLLARQGTPEKMWKLTSDDASERLLWDDYMHAYTDAINATSTSQSRWFSIPADDKPYARLQIARILEATLASLPLKYPAAMPGVDQLQFAD